MRALVWSIALTSLVFSLTATSRADERPATCTYKIWQWDTKKKTTANHRLVKKPYGSLTAEEKHPSGCTLCEEDQVEIRYSEHVKFSICRKYSEKVLWAIRQAVKEGFEVTSIVGYRPGKTLVPVDANGLMLGVSTHSYGTAIDINSEKNGLYNNCESFGPACSLAVGGAYTPKAPGGICKGSALHQAMKAIEWKWGGDWTGTQKDFMHFSLDGR